MTTKKEQKWLRPRGAAPLSDKGEKQEWDHEIGWWVVCTEQPKKRKAESDEVQSDKVLKTDKSTDKAEDKSVKMDDVEELDGEEPPKAEEEAEPPKAEEETEPPKAEEDAEPPKAEEEAEPPQEETEPPKAKVEETEPPETEKEESPKAEETV